MASERLAVVILTWNNADYTLACLQSLIEQATPHTVYVVDNASTDSTPERVAARFPDAHVIVNGNNLGFSGGNNVGMQAAFAHGAEAVVLLNNDTTLAPDALARLLAAADAHPEAGLLNPTILFAQSPHRVWFAGATLNIWAGWTYHKEYNTRYEAIAPDIRETPRATGCALLVTRRCYEHIGGFDDAYFMYFEDVEYSLRARHAGFAALLVPNAVVYHHVSVSAGEKSSNTIYYGIRNGIVTMERHYPLPLGVRQLRRALIVIGMLYYLAKPPRALARIRDVKDGFRDALRHHMGKRGATSAAYLPQTPPVHPPTEQVEEPV